MLWSVLKFIAVSAFVVAVVAFLFVFTMGGLAHSNGVKKVDLPDETYIFASAERAHYADAYCAEMQFNSFKSIDDVRKNTFHKRGVEIRRSETEVVYEAYTMGVRYEVAYILDRSARPPTITVATAAHCETNLGKVYFSLAKPYHRFLTPFRLDRMASVNSI